MAAPKISLENIFLSISKFIKQSKMRLIYLFCSLSVATPGVSRNIICVLFSKHIALTSLVVVWTLLEVAHI